MSTCSETWSIKLKFHNDLQDQVKINNRLMTISTKKSFYQFSFSSGKICMYFSTSSFFWWKWMIEVLHQQLRTCCITNDEGLERNIKWTWMDRHPKNSSHVVIFHRSSKVIHIIKLMLLAKALKIVVVGGRKTFNNSHLFSFWGEEVKVFVHKDRFLNVTIMRKNFYFY